MPGIPYVQSVGDVLRGIEQQQAQTQETVAQTQLIRQQVGNVAAQTQQRLQDVLLTQRKMDEIDKANQAMAEFGPGAQAAKNLTQQQQDISPTALLRQSLKDDIAEKNRLMVLSQRLANVGAYDLARQYQKEAYEVGRSMGTTAQALLRQQKDDAAEVGKIASSVTDEASFNTAMPQLLERDSTFGQKGNFDRDANGAVLWGPKTAQAFKALGEQSRTAEQKAADDIKLFNAQTAATRAESAAQVAQARVGELGAQAVAMSALAALRQAGVGKTEAQTEEIKAKTAKITTGDVSKAKMAAQKPPTKAAVQLAEDSVLSTPGFDDPDVKFPNLAAFSTDVASLANKIVADDAAAGTRTDYQDAVSQAIATLKPYVKDDETGIVFKDKIKKYVRPGGKVAGGAIREGGPGTTTAPGATVNPKAVEDDLVKKYGG